MRRYADLEIHIQKLQDAAYPVVLTLDVDGEQELGRGVLVASILPWVPSAVPADDGQRLFNLLFSTESLKEAWAQARGQAPLRHVRLHIDRDAPELHAIPWELLCDAHDGQPVDLASSDATPFSRFLAGEWRHGQPVRQRPIKVLAAIANPADLSKYNVPAIDVAEEQRALEIAIQDLGVALTLLPAPCTLPALEAELKNGYHVLHLVAHGAFAADQAVLFLANDGDQVQLVYDYQLRDMLARQSGDTAADRDDSLRLVFLASCDGAKRDTADALRGFAPKLVAAGVPAVLAMQDKVLIATAQAFTATFYRRLLDHGLVDLAANEARSHLLSAGLPGASIPVLFMRLRDGQLVTDGSEIRFIVPYLRNEYFTGRDIDLATLHDTLTDVGHPLAGIKAVGLFGLGGIGKTELAVEYCHRYRPWYPGGVFWINAAEPLEQGFAKLGRRLEPQTADQNLDVQIRFAARYLASHLDSLLVLDNLADPTSVLRQPVGEQLVPDDLRCRVLFTTRQRDLGRFVAVEVLELPEEPALRLLLRHPDRQPVLDPAHSDHGAAQAIARMLGRLPLALEIAGAYLGEWPDVSLEGFRARLRQDGRLATLDEAGAELPPANLREVHAAAVENTLREQWHALKPGVSTNQEAQLLFRTAGQLPEAAQIPVRYLGLLAGITDKPKAGSPSRLAKALRLLENACLIALLRSDEVRLHPLVHEFAAGLTPPKDRQAFRENLADHAITSLTDSDRPADWPITVGQCLLAFGWMDLPQEKRIRVIEAVRQVMVSSEDEGMARRAAFLLTRLDWLGLSPKIEIADMLHYEDLVGRYVSSSTESQYLVDHLTRFLAMEGQGAPERTQLLVRRGAMLGQMNKSEAAEQDYSEAARLILDFPADSYLAARVYLGGGNIARRRAEDPSTPVAEREQAQQQAEHLYGLLAQMLELDETKHELKPEFRITGHLQLLRFFVFLAKWREAEAHSELAMDSLTEVRDPDSHETHWGWIVQSRGELQWREGEWLRSKDQMEDALKAYENAYAIAQDVIVRLSESQVELSENLVYAFNNSAKYLHSMAEFQECSVSNPLTLACENWRQALELAERLEIPDEADEARSNLISYC
ncbi:MAG TPA: CHAT domain-containing protein [Anaerolineae bacterium]|nr:CHAT domain-containing protein [Anaerolineae bacterium]